MSGILGLYRVLNNFVIFEFYNQRWRKSLAINVFIIDEEIQVLDNWESP
jgi:hypothetical protein